jgi:hypothetical protein
MAAGDTYTIFRQRIFIATLGTALPSSDTPFGGTWTGWTQVKNTEEGAVISTSVPKEDIDSDENSGLGVVPEGGDQINISFTSMTPDMDLVEYLAQLTKEEVAGTAEVQTLTVTAPATSDGNVTVTLNGVAYTVGVTSASEGTTANLATRLRSSANYSPSLSGWNLSGSGSSVIFTSTTAEPKLGAFSLGAGGTGAAGTFAETTPGEYGYKRFSLDREGRQFMIGIEGKFDENSLYADSGFVRAFGYKVEQTDEVELEFRTKGADAILKPAASVRCLRTQLDPDQLTDSGISEVDERWDLFVFGVTAA